MQCLHPHMLTAPRIFIRCTPWCRISGRHYASDPQLEWFAKLRDEMLNRELPRLYRRFRPSKAEALEDSLRPFIPIKIITSKGKRVWPPEYHLIHFNHRIDPSKLLPDGTDALHSPGSPYVRRMWAGGSIRLDPEKYYDESCGWYGNVNCFSIERIKDVQLRDNDKILVKIERRFAPKAALRHNIGESPSDNAFDILSRKVPEAPEFGVASMVEERNLLFMRERSAEDLGASLSGTIRYLPSSKTPEFSHTLIPTAELLSCFSQLTANKHAIHLDREYTRNVEGHRNLLVHGPLTLTLLLRFVTNHLNNISAHTPQVIQSIEYRNLAPLYCDEQMRLCARRRTQVKIEGGRRADEEGHIYDVWIEGPTGGIAVKGTIHTAPGVGVAQHPDLKAHFTRRRSLVRLVEAPPRPMKAVFSRRQQLLARQIVARRAHPLFIESAARKCLPMPLVRKYKTTKEHRIDPLPRFALRGVKKVASRPVIRYKSQKLEYSRLAKKTMLYWGQKWREEE
ncbi:hypothetical protein CC78DRAFT_570781 [Lojkania enalia]|uniref:Uncharacterized protein n=1 Tax=Lojkania enalia TaxID=147567 RepID=A0A9P4K4A2_9PLEO|nr:hypothetical protein CC78DRAFT_570781 [Didymosphaeria enalia]